eukprot:6404453-Alexandrium_andersonii.AAC.1
MPSIADLMVARQRLRRAFRDLWVAGRMPPYGRLLVGIFTLFGASAPPFGWTAPAPAGSPVIEPDEDS